MGGYPFFEICFMNEALETKCELGIQMRKIVPWPNMTTQGGHGEEEKDSTKREVS